MLCKDGRLKLQAVLLKFISEKPFHVLILRTALKSMRLSTGSVLGILRMPELSCIAVESVKWFIQPSWKANWHNLL